MSETIGGIALNPVTVQEITKKCGGNTRTFLAVPGSKDLPRIPFGISTKVYWERTEKTLELRYVFNLNDLPPF